MLAQLPDLMQYGAMGVLAMGFLVLLGLYVRSDKRNERYARNISAVIEELRDERGDRDRLIGALEANSAVNTQVAERLAALGGQQRQVLDIVLECPTNRQHRELTRGHS